MLTIIVFVLILGLLVFVHELGHFLTARRNGIKADEFGFGFPPRIAGVVWDDALGRFRFVRGSEDVASEHTVYSLNWIPLGGFVRIKGEDMSHAHETDSFAGKSAWVRFKVLVAGVTMNMFLAWVLFSIVLMLGFPQQISPAERGKFPVTQVQILQTANGSPADEMGLMPGDVLLALDGQAVSNLSFVSEYINAHKGKSITVSLRRGETDLELSGTPRAQFPDGEGPLGISFSETAIVSYPWYIAIGEGLRHTFEFTVEILKAFGTMLANLFTGTKQTLDVAGPIGIVYLTKQMSELGFVYILQFAAVLSINLAIINVLPIPALDGGRILFILIEKFKGSPVSRRTEGIVHQTGFIVLILLMLLITFHDFLQFEVWQKFTGFF